MKLKIKDTINRGLLKISNLSFLVNNTHLS